MTDPNLFVASTTIRDNNSRITYCDVLAGSDFVVEPNKFKVMLDGVLLLPAGGPVILFGFTIITLVISLLSKVPSLAT
jgi:hypothetical protein